MLVMWNNVFEILELWNVKNCVESVPGCASIWGMVGSNCS
jgi:hypothetical protein